MSKEDLNLKKVLIIGPDFYGYNLSVAKSFEELGYKTKIVSYKDAMTSIVNRLKYNYLPKKNIKGFKNKYINEINSNILDAYSIFQPNIIFIIKGNFIDEKTLNNMNNSYKVIWLMDSITSTEDTIKTIKLYDQVFIFEQSDYGILKKLNIESIFLPLSFDSSIYFPLNIEKKNIDISFVGTIYDNRREILESIVKDFKECNIEIYGKYLSLRNPSTFYKYYFKGYKRYFKNKNISPDMVNVLYNNSKIVLNIHHAQSVSGCNPRVFEILGAKSLQIVDNNDYITSIFNRDEIICFSSIENLKDNIRLYLEDADKRNFIAERGHQKVVNGHKFVDRIRMVVDSIE